MNSLRKLTSALAASLLCSGAALAQGFQAEDSASTRNYGIATGQTAQPSSRVQVFGFPAQGRTVDLQLLDARPGVAAWFYLSFAPANLALPGLGTALIDLGAPSIVGSVTDGSGRASVQMPIPYGVPSGTTVYVQCLTADVLGALPLFELSSASELTVGEIALPITSAANLDGSLTLQNGTTLSGMSGLYGSTCAPFGGASTVEGSVSLQVKAADFALNGIAVEDFKVHSGKNATALVWDANNCHTATSFYTGFTVSYRIGATEHGPLDVTGVLTSNPTSVSLDLSPIPTLGAGALGGVDLALQFTAHRVGAGYFDVRSNLWLPADGSEGSLVTAEDADLAFSTMSAAMANALATAQVDVTYYDAFMPAYPEFQALESQILRKYSDGRASDMNDVQQLIQTNAISQRDGWLWMIASKLLSAVGVSDGWDAFKEVLKDNCGSKLEEIGKHIDAKDYTKAYDKICEVLDFLCSDRFRSQFMQKAGNKMAGEILEKIGSKCIPFIGWLYFAACLLWAFVEQWL